MRERAYEKVLVIGRHRENDWSTAMTDVIQQVIVDDCVLLLQ